MEAPGKALESENTKTISKNLVVIDYQGENQLGEVLAVADYHKVFDGCMRYTTDRSEMEIRNEIVRLVQQKESITHEFNNLQPQDIDFVRYSNRKVRCIDGDVPFDCNGINQVYKNGAVYVRFNIDFSVSENVRLNNDSYLS